MVATEIGRAARQESLGVAGEFDVACMIERHCQAGVRGRTAFTDR